MLRATWIETIARKRERELIMYLRRRGRSAVLCRVVVAGRAPREVAEERLRQRSGAAVLVVDGRHELVELYILPIAVRKTSIAGWPRGRHSGSKPLNLALGLRYLQYTHSERSHHLILYIK